MKRIIGAAMLIAATPAAWAQDARISAEEKKSYFSFGAGAIADDEFVYDIPGGDAEFETETGYGISAAYGRVFSPSIRGEVSLSYSKQDLDVVRLHSGPVILIFEEPGQVTSWSLGANGYYDFATSGSFRPYVGAGVGIASVDIGNGALRQERTAAKAQVAAGTRWMMQGNTSLFLEGRYDAYIMELDFDNPTAEVDDTLTVDNFGIYAGVKVGF